MPEICDVMWSLIVLPLSLSEVLRVEVFATTKLSSSVASSTITCSKSSTALVDLCAMIDECLINKIGHL